MELRQLESFSKIARFLSFRRAAGELGVTQPALTQQVMHLERELGLAELILYAPAACSYEITSTRYALPRFWSRRLARMLRSSPSALSGGRSAGFSSRCRRAFKASITGSVASPASRTARSARLIARLAE
jgi:hypothetical protein